MVKLDGPLMLGASATIDLTEIRHSDFQLVALAAGHSVFEGTDSVRNFHPHDDQLSEVAIRSGPLSILSTRKVAHT